MNPGDSWPDSCWTISSRCLHADQPSVGVHDAPRSMICRCRPARCRPGVSPVDPAALDDICRRYGIATLAVFGSVARGEESADSDVDLLYELRPGARLGWEIADLSDELAALWGRPVDLVAKVAVHPRLRDRVLDESRLVYAA